MPDHRCRLCTANDREALIEHLAEQFWESQRGGMDDWPWADAGEYWQPKYRRFAAVAIDAMRG